MYNMGGQVNCGYGKKTLKSISYTGNMWCIYNICHIGLFIIFNLLIKPVIMVVHKSLCK